MPYCLNIFVCHRIVGRGGRFPFAGGIGVRHAGGCTDMGPSHFFSAAKFANGVDCSFALSPVHLIIVLHLCVWSGEFPTRTYPVYRSNADIPKPLSQLVTPAGAPLVSDGDKTSGATIDNDHDTAEWGNARAQDGLLASAGEAHCILLDGNPDRRLNPKVCERRGVKLVNMPDTDELYSSGSRAKPPYSEWVNAHLCTFHRGPHTRARQSKVPYRRLLSVWREYYAFWGRKKEKSCTY